MSSVVLSISLAMSASSHYIRSMGSTATASQVTEAVIISGSRKGQIIRIDDIEWDALNDKLDKLNSKLAAVSREIRASTKAFKSAR